MNWPPGNDAMGRSDPDNIALRSVVEILRQAYRSPDLNGLVSIVSDHLRQALPAAARDPVFLESMRARMTAALAELCAARDQGRGRGKKLTKPESEFREALEAAAEMLDGRRDSQAGGEILRAAADGLLDAARLQCERAASSFALNVVKDLELLGARPSLAYATDGTLIWQNSALAELIEHRGIDRDRLMAEAWAFAEPLCQALSRGEIVKTAGSRKQRGTGVYLRPVAHRSGVQFPAGAIVVRISELKPSAELSPRELQAARAICAGKAYREAASAMGISLDSVRTLVRRAYRKLGVRNRVAMKARLTREGKLPR